MAATRITWFGVVVDLNHREVGSLVHGLSNTSNTVSGLSALLASQGITGTPLVISGIISALFGLGAKSISGCDSNNKGIHLVVLWVGAPWCQPL
jgi:hypothetical protein